MFLCILPPQTPKIENYLNTKISFLSQVLDTIMRELVLKFADVIGVT